MPDNRAQVFRVLNETARSIEHIDGDTLRAVYPVLKRAQEELEHDLMTWLCRENGRSEFTAQRYRNAIMVVRRALRAGRQVQPTLEKALKTSTTQVIAPLALKNVQREWEAFSMIFEGTVQPLTLEEAAIISRGKRLLWPEFESSAKKYAGSIGERAQLELAVSKARGETIQELTTRLHKTLYNTFEGERWDAERLARTETMRAYSEVATDAMNEALEDDPELVRRCDATYDFRRCPLCGSLDGQVRKIGEDFHAVWVTKTKKGIKQHSKRFKDSPFHPNCRCVVSLWRESWGHYARKSPTAAPALRLAA